MGKGQWLLAGVGGSLLVLGVVLSLLPPSVLEPSALEPSAQEPSAQETGEREAQHVEQSAGTPALTPTPAASPTPAETPAPAAQSQAAPAPAAPAPATPPLPPPRPVAEFLTPSHQTTATPPPALPPPPDLTDASGASVAANMPLPAPWSVEIGLFASLERAQHTAAQLHPTYPAVTVAAWIDHGGQMWYTASLANIPPPQAEEVARVLRGQGFSPVAAVPPSPAPVAPATTAPAPPAAGGKS